MMSDDEVLIDSDNNFFLNDGNFHEITLEEAETRKIRKLRRLRRLDVKQAITFKMHLTTLSGPCAEDIIETFQHFSSKGDEWSCLEIAGFDQENPNFRKVLSKATQLKLFRILDFRCEDIITYETARILQEAMIHRTLFKDFILYFTYLTEQISAIISDGLRRSETINRLELWGVKFIQMSDGNRYTSSERSSELFSEGIKKNRTLKIFAIVKSNLLDSGVSNLIESLIGHPTLNCLVLYEQMGVSSLDLMGKLLGMRPCRITSLNLTQDARMADQNQSTENFHHLLSSLQASHSLENLCFSGYQFGIEELRSVLLSLRQCHSLEILAFHKCSIDVDLSQLFSVLSICPQLQDVNVSYNHISKMGSKNFEPTTIRRLILDGNPIAKENAHNGGGDANDKDSYSSIEPLDPSLLLDFLRSNTRLAFLGSDIESSEIFSPRTQHLLDQNFCWRVFRLLQDDRRPTLSSWCVVFEMVNKAFARYPQRQASIVQSLVKALSVQLGRVEHRKSRDGYIRAKRSRLL